MPHLLFKIDIRRRVLKFKINNICGCIVLPRAGVLLCAVAARVHVHVHARAVHVYIHACNACYCRAYETFNAVHAHVYMWRSGFAGSSNAHDIFYSAQTIRVLNRLRGGNNRAHGHPSKVPVRPRPAPTTAARAPAGTGGTPTYTVKQAAGYSYGPAAARWASCLSRFSCARAFYNCSWPYMACDCLVHTVRV